MLALGTSSSYSGLDQAASVLVGSNSSILWARGLEQ